MVLQERHPECSSSDFWFSSLAFGAVLTGEVFSALVCQGFGGGKGGKPIAQAAHDADFLLCAVRAHRLKAWMGSFEGCLLGRLESIGWSSRWEG